MGRSCPSMPPFNVDIFVFQPVSPMDFPTLKGASRHKHGSKVNFVQGGSRFHAASDSKSCCYPLSGFPGLDFLSGFVKTDVKVWISYVNIVSALQGPGSLPDGSSGPSVLFLDVFVFRSHKDHAYRHPMYLCTRIARSYARAPGLGFSTTLLTHNAEQS